MRYTARYFRESMPEWKRKKDPALVRFITRPLSFYVSATLSNWGITANSVSYFSGWIAISGACCYLFNCHIMNIVGSLFVFFWLLLDCVDGNMARSVKKLPFGEFADAISSYMLVGIIITFIGYATYKEGGAIIPAGKPWIILLGAIASSSDTMMRLIYQKYKATERELADANVLPVKEDVFKDHSKVGDWRVRMNMEMGIAGLLTVLIIVCSVCSSLDIVVFYFVLYYGGSCAGAYLFYVKKAIRASKKFADKMPQ